LRAAVAVVLVTMLLAPVVVVLVVTEHLLGHQVVALLLNQN
jgi:hypothetical protein